MSFKLISTSILPYEHYLKFIVCRFGFVQIIKVFIVNLVVKILIYAAENYSDLIVGAIPKVCILHVINTTESLLDPHKAVKAH